MSDQRIPISQLSETQTAPDASYIAIDDGSLTKKITVENFNSTSTASAQQYANQAAASAQTVEDNIATSAAQIREATLAAREATQASTSATASATSAYDSASLAQNYSANASTSAGQAMNAADSAAQNLTASKGYAEDSEAWAVGKRNGSDVPSSDDTYHNNAKYYSDNATTAATSAASDADRAEAAAESINVPDITLSVNGVAADSKVTGEMTRTALDSLAVLIADSASGSVATFTDEIGGLPFRLLTVTLEPVQSGSGDPSPTNVRLINGHTDATVTIEGENSENRKIFSVLFPTEAGTVYGGTLDLIRGKLIVNKILKTCDADSNVGKGARTSVDEFYLRVSPVDLGALGTFYDADHIICSHAKNVEGDVTDEVYTRIAAGQARIVFPTSYGMSDLATFKTWLSDQSTGGTPLQFCYMLETPIEYTFIPQEIKTLPGTNVVFADHGDVNVEYFIDTKGYVDSHDIAVDDTLSVSGDAADSKVTGDAVAELELRAYEGFSADESLVTISDLEDGFYSSVNGKKTDNTASSTYRRAKSLVPVKEKMLYASGNIDIRAACYTADGTYISSIRIYADASNAKRIATPEDTALIGLYAADATSFILRKIDSFNVVGAEYPYHSDKYILKEGYWCNGNGGIYASANFDLLIFGGITPGDKYYVSNNASANCLCFDVSGNLLTTQSQSRNVLGKIYTIPDGAVVACFNLYVNRKTGVNNDMVDYVAKLNGKKILAIGDSITWLDGRQNYGGAAYVSGWQRKLRLLGYDVVNAGWSGNPYTYGINVTEGTDNSIYTKIVTNSYDVTGYDYVIMFGGTNDVLYNAPIGNRSTDYSNRTFDSATFNGAVSGIISYVRTNNPNCKILMASFPKSEVASRVYPNASKYVDEIMYNATFWSCKYVNIFDDMNVQPTYQGFTDNFYDATHPNFNGMVKIGHLMCKAVEQYE